MVDESTKMVLKRKNKQSILKSLLVFLVLLLFMGTTVLFVFLLSPGQVIAKPLSVPTGEIGRASCRERV